MEYNEQIKELLESYHDKIETDIMPQLTKEFYKLYAGVTEFFGKLKNKGLIKEDPYFKESEIIELTIPSLEMFEEADAQWKVAERLTHYVSILSFITHNYTFSLNTFNFSELEKIKQFLDYYDWKSLLNPSTAELNTRSLGKIAIEFRSATGDTLILKTYEKCIDGIIKSIDQILIKLKFVLLYLKESYKLFIRVDILPIIKEKNPNILVSKVLDSISDEIKKNYSYLKFYKKFISEVINEEFSSDGSVLKDNIIKKLSITKKNETKEKKDDKVDTTKNLIQLLMEIGKIRIHLASSMEKLYFNHNNLRKADGNFIIKFFRFLGSQLFNTKTKTVYNISIPTKSGKGKSLEIHFEKFYDEIKKLEFDLLNFAEEDKTTFYVRDNKSEINKKIDILITSIKKQIKIFVGLDNYLKFELKNSHLKAKGIKPEITVMKTIINSSTAMYREYLDEVDGK
ncbi:hypothetical protein EW093_16355 [Thiospirochaeta perfilievii]|uniref:Uncharacterized protein n=1 Tax=Thiospirochaeta perfilievii TaxID=252967 RepID=A0A5C1QF95_9SPIO|nr:hypothetical protein [Thiospirochaeta perfilievii]QEN06191.1 hypothetical protein EW093_16355 [Thiospirochaeta perfilievii]